MTEKHITDVSMCALFLMEAANKVFSVSSQTTSHTVRDSNSEIGKMQQLLLDKEIIVEKQDRTAPPFTDSTVLGLNLLTKTDWLQNQLCSFVLDDLQHDASDAERGITTVDYELSDVF